MIKEVTSSLCVDPSRVLATGCSNGGMLTYHLGGEGGGRSEGRLGGGLKRSDS